MPTMANWNGHTFEISPNLIRGYTNMRIKGSCETTTKNSDKQKYVEHKYGEIPEISMDVGLSALTGVTDVFSEAMQFVKEATEGACNYFYVGASKLIPAKMMLIEAEVTDIENMPGKGDTWIRCDIKLTFKQGAKNDSGGGSSGSSGGSSSASIATKSKSVTQQLKDLKAAGVKPDEAKVKALTEGAKAFSAAQKQKQTTGLDARMAQAEKATTTTVNTALKTTATTGRVSCEITNTKITRIPTALKPTLDLIK